MQRPFDLGTRASERSPGERYALAQVHHPLVMTAVGMLMERRHLSEDHAFLELERVAVSTGMNLDDASARVIFDL